MTSIKHLLAAGAFLVSGMAFAQKPIIIKFSFVTPAESSKGMAAEFFKKQAEEKTGGRVKIELYPNSTLYKDKEELEALNLGAVQMLAPTLGKFGPAGAREFELFDLPFLFDNYDQVHKITEGPIGKKMLASLADKGMTGLAFWDSGFKQMNANKPLKTLADFKGTKMRIFSSKVLDAQMRSFGANPQVLPASEIYSSMQTGLVDGGENVEAIFYKFKFYEVQKYMTISNHGYTGYAVVVNKKFWDGLPADIRTALDSAMKASTAYANQLALKENADGLEAVRKSGKTEIYELPPGERAQWKKVSFKVHAASADRIGKDLLNATYKELNFKP